MHFFLHTLMAVLNSSIVLFKLKKKQKTYYMQLKFQYLLVGIQRSYACAQVCMVMFLLFFLPLLFLFFTWNQSLCSWKWQEEVIYKPVWTFSHQIVNLLFFEVSHKVLFQSLYHLNLKIDFFPPHELSRALLGLWEGLRLRVRVRVRVT